MSQNRLVITLAALSLASVASLAVSCGIGTHDQEHGDPALGRP